MYNTITNIGSFVNKITDGASPKIGVVLGSGLGNFVDCVDIKFRIPYVDIPGMPTSTVEGHRGEFIFGTIGGKSVIIANGRFHYYEGYDASQVAIIVRVMSYLGVNTLMLSNAAGGLNKSLSVGDLMVIKDHINFIPNPLIGKNISEFGERFPAMNNIYDLSLRDLAQSSAKELGLVLKKGVYVAVSGPSYETSAEVNFYRIIGGDAVGMSTAPESVAAKHAGMRTLAVSVITNVHNDDAVPTHSEVVEQGLVASKRLSELYKYIITKL